MLTSMQILDQYKTSIEFSLNQLEQSKETTNLFQNVLNFIISNLKDCAENAKMKLKLETKKNIDKINNIPNLQNLATTSSDATQIKAKTDLEEAQNLQGFEYEYFSKITYLEKFIKNKSRIMDNILRSFEFDKNELFAICSDIREKLGRLKQNISTKILKQNFDVVQLNTIITSTHTKVDSMNLKINKYNSLIDKFNNMGIALQSMMLSYVNPKNKMQLYFININDYFSTIEQATSYNKDYSDPIRKSIEDFFLTQLQTPIQLIKIEAPDLSFKSLWVDDDVIMSEFKYDLANVPQSQAPANTIALPNNINDNAKIKLTTNDWNSLNSTLAIRYAELCSNIVGNITRVNISDANSNLNFVVDIQINANYINLLYKYDVNSFMFFASNNQSEDTIPVFMKNIINTYRVDIYKYNVFNIEELLLVLNMIANKNVEPLYYYITDVSQLLDIIRNSIQSETIIQFITRKTVCRMDIVHSKNNQILNKKRKIN